MLTGGSIIFFTYIGFDSFQPPRRKCKNPQRDVPIGIIATLVVATILYIGWPWCSRTGSLATLMDDAAPEVNTLTDDAHAQAASGCTGPI